MSKKINKQHAYALGFTIARERKRRGWSATAFAQRLGVSRSCVASWEVAISSPTWGNLVDLAAVLRMPLSTLIRHVEIEMETLANANAIEPTAAGIDAEG